MEISIINPLDYPSWNELVLSNPGYSFFHSSNWARVLYESYNYKPVYFTLVDKDRLLVSVPVMEIRSLLTGNRGVSLPFTDYCAPIVADYVNFKKVLQYITEYGKRVGWRSIELRGGGDLLQAEKPSSHYYEHILELFKGEKLLFSNFRDSTKRNIKKAIKEDVNVNICNSLESVTEFYRLNCMSRKEHGLPPQPYYFFRKIYEHIISKNHGYIVLASYGGRTIAGAVCFHFGKRAVYKYGASDKKYQHLRVNNLVIWEAIKWYSKNGYKSFSFGRTEPDNSGLRQFKAGWGAEENFIKYYRYDLKKSAFINGKSHISGSHNKIFNNIPIPLSKIIGSLFYKHIG